MKIKIKRIKNADLSQYSSIKIGGRADIYFPRNFMELKCLMGKFKNYYILGNGSNILFTENFKGIIVSMRDFSHIFMQNGKIVCGAGVSLFKFHAFCLEHGLGGGEFLYGIPGSIGGAIAMNAGAYGGEICELVESITVFKDGDVFEKKDLEFSYRKGPLEDGEILLEAIINLKRAEKSQIFEKQMWFLNNRRASQPYSSLSLGSVFKRQGDVIPAKLIDEWGLKGIRIGGALVSEKHAGFIVSDGSASAGDVIALIELIEKVAENHGYHFEREIKIV